MNILKYCLKLKIAVPALTIFLFSNISFAQQGWWTWMHGNSTPNTAPVFGTMGVANAANTPPCVYQTFDWTDKNGNFWIFGGMDFNGNFYSAMWMYNPATTMWTWMKGPNTTNSFGIYGVKGTPAAVNNPGARLCGLTWTDNNGDLWLYGGYGFANTNNWTNLADLWKYSITTNMWTWMSGPNTPNAAGIYGTQGIPAASNYPPPRSETNASWTDNNGDLWLFGGFAYTTTNNWYNDLWKYDIITNQWTWMKGSNMPNSAGSYGTMGVAAPANCPSARETFSKWKDINGNLWMFGAGKADTIGNIYRGLNDLWKYDISTNEWTWIRGSNIINSPGSYGTLCVSSPGNDPPARWENKACWTDTCGNFWMFGGQGKNQNAEYYNDLWHYNVAANEWVWVSSSNTINNMGSYGTKGLPAPGNRPGSRGGAAAFLHKNTDIYLFGGINQFPATSQSYNDLWRFTIDTNCVKMGCTTYYPTANFNSITNGCAPLTVTFNNTSLNSTSWSWDFGDGTPASTLQNPVHTYTAAGTYTVTLIAYYPPNSDTLVQPNYISVGQSPVINTSITASISCNGGSNGAASVTVTSGVPSYTYSWSNGQTTSSATALSNGNYTVTVTDASGCSSTQTVSVSHPPALTATITTTPSTCNTSDGTAAASAAGGSGGYTYLWNNGQTAQTATGLPAGNYSCMVTDGNGCTQFYSASIINSNGPTATATGSTVIQQGDSTALHASGGVSYSWSPSAGLSNSSVPDPIATPTISTAYCVFVFDSAGCYDSACVIVIVTPEPVVCGEFYIPNAFSPNNDDENDVFKAFINPVCVKEFRLAVYNRWGELVFETYDVKETWNGKYRGGRIRSCGLWILLHRRSYKRRRNRKKGKREPG